MLGLTPPRICLRHAHLHHITHYIYKEQIMQQLQNIIICKWQMTHSWLFTYTSPVSGPWRSIYDLVVIFFYLWHIYRKQTLQHLQYDKMNCVFVLMNVTNNIIVCNVYKKIIPNRTMENLLHFCCFNLCNAMSKWNQTKPHLQKSRIFKTLHTVVVVLHLIW